MSFTAFSSSLNNDHITSPAYSISDSGKEGGCQTIGGITICEDYELNWNKKEYYKGGFGSIGYYSFNSGSFSGGGFYSYSSTTINAGLVDSLLPAERPLDTPTTTTTTPPATVTSGESSSSQKTSAKEPVNALEGTPGFLWIPVMLTIISLTLLYKRKHQ